MASKQGYFNNQKGSVTVEFIGILPAVFIGMLVLWQFLMGVYAVIVTQSAANEAAKVYSITENESEAEQAAEKIVETVGETLTFDSLSISNTTSDGYFTVNVDVSFNLTFLPDIITKNVVDEDEQYLAIPIEQELRSRKIH
ncbi:pilus assembly protein [Brevibacillus humidisoli]|uniref:TadE/TadG family type IV pilus assembly protein n=1 Tax=Brevibacillus humidisoli TaxID=2895522 RepID=UPI001E4A6D29|nr:TadE family protein [Brevibacillus humidisoli]UFJ39240.1 pilus assembly protein [Brevibacillus humidisoli]